MKYEKTCIMLLNERALNPGEMIDEIKSAKDFLRSIGYEVARVSCPNYAGNRIHNVAFLIDKMSDFDAVVFVPAGSWNDDYMLKKCHQVADKFGTILEYK